MIIRFSKAYCIAFILMLLGLLIIVTPVLATTYTINLSVVLDDKVTAFTDSALTVIVNDPDGKAIDLGGSNKTDDTTGKLTIPGLSKTGNYIVSVSDGEITEIVKVAVSASTSNATIVWSDYHNYTRIKTGAIGGVIYNQAGELPSGVAVKIVGSKATWTTTTYYGYFKVYLPAATYKLIVYGKDSGCKNYTYSLVVPAGETVNPIDDMSYDVPWAGSANKLGFVITGGKSSITNATTEINGNVNSDATVYVIDADTNQVITTAKTTVPKTGLSTFKAILPNIQPGKTLKFKVVDSAENIYYETIDPLAKLSALTLAPIGGITTGSSTFDYGKAVQLNFTDTKKLMSAVSTTVYASAYPIDPLNLKFAAGSVIISAGVLDVGTYSIKLKNAAFDESTIDVTIQASTSTVAPALTATPSKPGDAGTNGTTILTVSPAIGRSIYFLTSSVATTAPKIGSNISTIIGANRLTIATVSGTVYGVNPLGEKYVGVYEVTSLGTITKYKGLTLTSSVIKSSSDSTAPTTIGGYYNSLTKEVTWKFSENIYAVKDINTLKAAIKRLTPSHYGPLASNDTVTLNGDDTLTIHLAETSDVLTSPHNTFDIPVGALQDGFGNKNISLGQNISPSDSPFNSTVTAPASYDKNGGLTLAIRMSLRGNTLTGISDGGTLITPTDYTVSGNIVMLKKTYLQGKAIGAVTLTFTFDHGAIATTVITVSDTTTS